MHKNVQYILAYWVALFCLFVSPVLAAYSLDTNFGESGQVSESFGGISNRGHGVVIQPDGAIVVAGSRSSSADHDFSLLRLLPDGSYDSSFNGDGRVVTAIGRADDEILAVGLLSDGRIVAGGYSESATDRDFALACYDEDGNLDRNFGDDGIVIMEVGQQHDEITALTVTEDDKIVIAGVAEGTSGRVIVAGRFDSNGEPDETFGEQGLALIGVGEDAVAEDVVVLGNGAIVISGSYSEADQLSLILVGLLEDGSIDADFGIDGVAMPPEDIELSEGFGMALSDADELYLAAAVADDDQFDAVLFRFTADGQPDLQFEGKGYTHIYAGPEDDIIYDVKVVSQDQVVVTGYATESGVQTFLMATYSLTANEAEEFGQQNTPTPELVKISTLQVDSGSISGEQEDAPQEIEIYDSFEEFFNSGVSTQPVHDAVGATDHVVSGFFERVFSSISRFFAGEAVAAELEESEDSEGSVSVTLLDTDSEDATGYALAVTEDGEVVVVSTESDGETETLTVSSFSETAATSASSSTDGLYLVTTPVTAINRTGALTGGTITGLTSVSQKGVVYSIDPFPQYSDGDDDSDDDSSTLTVTITNPSDSGTETDTSVTLSATTNISAQCAYDTTNTDFDSMNLISSSYVTSHSTSLSLTDGTTYTYYVRCQTSDGDEDVDSVTFTVDTSSASTTAILNEAIHTASNFFVADAMAADDDDDDDDDDDTSDSLFGSGTTTEFDEEGETDNGSGTSQYSARLENLKPGTIFYVRAYAVSNGTTYYGNQLSFRTEDSCFIATASYGSLFHPAVALLREFRDTYLHPSALGRKFVDTYYTLSPPIADVIASSELLRLSVRLLLVPFIGFSWLALQLGIWQAALASLCLTVSGGFLLWNLYRTFSLRTTFKEQARC